MSALILRCRISTNFYCTCSGGFMAWMRINPRTSPIPLIIHKVYPNDHIQVHVRDVNIPTCCAYWLPGNHKNMSNTTCYIRKYTHMIQTFTSINSTSQRRSMPTCCAYWLPGIPRQSNIRNLMAVKQKTSTYTSTCDALPGDPVPLPPLLLAPVPPARVRVQLGVSPGDPAALLPPPPASVAPTVPTVLH